MSLGKCLFVVFVFFFSSHTHTPHTHTQLSGFGVQTDPTTGNTLSVDMDIPYIEWYNAKGWLEDGVRMGVFFDDAFDSSFLVKPDDKETVRTIAVPVGTSSVQVLRLSEDIYATGSDNAPTLHSLSATVPVTPLPERPTYLFVGDSDTAGFGIHAYPGDFHCLNPYELWETIVDGSLSWAAQLAKLMDVEPVVTAVSGVGIDGAYGNKPWKSYRDNANPYDYEQIHDYKSETAPTAILILLGPNDCGKSNGLRCPDDWQVNYVETLEHYAGAYDTNPPIVSIIGGSSSGYNDELVDAVANATKTFNEGREWKGAMEVMLSKDVWDKINDKKKGNNGCMGHYNEKGHGMVAADLMPKLKAIL